ncbi:DNRLRE domain-containing protein [Bacteroidota bacterium]
MKHITGLLIILILAVSCNEDPTSVGSQLIPGGDFLDFQILDSFTDTLQQTSSYTLDDIDLKRSTKILVGKNENIESWMLMRFLMLFPDSALQPLTVDSLNIVSTKVEMRPNYRFGDPAGTFDFTVHRVYDAWTPSGFDKDSMSSLVYDPADYSSNKTVTDSLITFDIDTSLVLDWLRRTWDLSYPENHGVVFIPTPNTTRIFGFPGYDAYTTEFLTQISIVYEKPGIFTDTVVVIPFSDVHAVRGEMPIGNPENIILQGGLTTRGQLHFDVSEIPQNSIVNRATLQLFVDTLETVNGTVPTDSIRVFIYKNVETKSIIDSTIYYTLVRDSGSAFYEGEVSRLVQEWISGVDNQGFRINISDEARSVNKIAIKGSDSSDPALRPRLKVIYSKKM